MLIDSKYTDRCKRCHTSIKVGDRVGWKPGEKGTWCMTCVPDDVKNPPKFTGAHPQAESRAKSRLPTPPRPLGESSLFKAMAQFEDAVIEKFTAPRAVLTPEAEKSWDKYSKLKARAMAPGTPEEGRVALKFALIEVIKAVM